MQEIEEVTRTEDDTFLDFLIYFYYYIYFKYWHVLPEQSEYYSRLLRSTYQNIEFEDSWEENFVEFAYNHSYFADQYREISSEEIQKRIFYLEKGLQAIAKNGQEGETISELFSNNLAHSYFRLGDIEKAQDMYHKSYNLSKISSDLGHLFNLGYIIWFYLLTGNTLNAQKYNEEQLQLATQLNSRYYLNVSFRNQGYILQKTGNYEDALVSFLKSLDYSLKGDILFEQFISYYDLFYYYNELYRVKDERHIFEKTKYYQMKMDEITQQEPLNDRMRIYNLIAKALVLKHGNFKQKGEAVEILEELFVLEGIDRRQLLLVSINLLELLFENISLAFDKKLVQKIEEIILKLNSMPLHTNPASSYHYVIQKILISKYYYFLKNDVSQAINLLTSIREEIQDFKLKNVKELLNKELDLYAQEKEKWETIDSSIKDKLAISEFQSYLKDALRLVNQQPDQQ